MAAVFGAATAQTPDGKTLVTRMVENERVAGLQKLRLEYTSVERSERTGGHAWTERVAETPTARVRFLLAVDGVPLDAAGQARERGRLAADLADPTAFEAREAAQKDDEAHARLLLQLLARGFLFENIRRDGPDWRIDFKPDPDYSPSGTEEKVVHAMNGTLAIDAAQLRLHVVDGSLPTDLSLAFGLATVKAGTHFSSTKGQVEGAWRTLRVVSDVRGKAVLFKSLSKNTDVVRSDSAECRSRWGWRRL